MQIVTVSPSTSTSVQPKLLSHSEHFPSLKQRPSHSLISEQLCPASLVGIAQTSPIMPYTTLPPVASHVSLSKFAVVSLWQLVKLRNTKDQIAVKFFPLKWPCTRIFVFIRLRLFIIAFKSFFIFKFIRSNW